MVAVAIVGVMAAAIVPAISAVQADTRQSSAPMALLRLSREAVGRTRSHKVAHMLLFQDMADDAGDGLGRVRLLMGMKPRCMHTDWNWLIGQADTQEAPSWTDPRPFASIERVAMARFNPIGDGGTAPLFSDTDRHVIWLRGNPLGGSAQETIRICYQTNGMTYSADATNTNLVPQPVTYEFSVRRRHGPVGGTESGVARQVLFPPGGSPRIR